MQAKLLDEIRHLHRYGHPRSVVDRTRAKIPGIEMSRDNDDLLGMFGSLQIGDHVVTHGVGQLLRCEDETHSHRPLQYERRDQVGVFLRHGGGGNFRGVGSIISLAGMWQTVGRAADRTDERRNSAESGGRTRPVAAIDDGFSVSFSALALGRHLFVEGMIEKDDLAADFFFAQRSEFVEVADHERPPR